MWFLELLERVCCTAAMVQLKPAHTEQILALRDKSLGQEAVWRTKKQSKERQREREKERTRCVFDWWQERRST